MYLRDVKIGDKFFWIKFIRESKFFKRIEIYECEIVKLNRQTLHVVYTPFKKQKTASLKRNYDYKYVGFDYVELLTTFVKNADNLKFAPYLKKSCKEYCLRKLKQYRREKRLEVESND